MTNPEELFTDIVDGMLNDIHNDEQDNIETARFADPIRYRKERIRLARSAWDYLSNHSDKVAAAHDLLSDDESRSLFVELLRFRLAGPGHVRLRTNSPAHWALREKVGAIKTAPSILKLGGGLFGPLQHFSIPFEDRVVEIDCWPANVAWTFLIKQYYFERNHVRISPQKGEVLIDGGACLGDTSLAFSATSGSSGAVHSFELYNPHLPIMKNNFDANAWAKIDVHPYGLSDMDQDGPLHDGPGLNPGFAVRAAKAPLPLRRLDTLMDGSKVSRVDFIKLDVEGSELAALRGAEGVLRRNRPKLAIALYHDVKDFAEIPLWIDSLNLGYRFYLDHYTIYHEETVLYATCDAA